MLTQTVASRESSAPALPAGKGTMTSLLIVTAEAKTALSIQAPLARSGFACAAVSYDNAAAEFSRQAPELVILELSGRDDAREWKLISRLKKRPDLPLIALVPEQALTVLDDHPEIDDFIVGAYKESELVLRVNRLLHRSGDSVNPDEIRCDGLTIDMVTCEVTVNGGKVELTFKEYELLKLMAASKGRVYTRQVLLDKIWGYDYFGGDRTVDVHVRRLRGKIEDGNHTYIETVRNIGYRFIKNA
ncbi:MAG: response regulator transcription factor [Dehalococcoidales bacterium]|jgi:two-component system alkaline phosphatase synthesis response regulator PhoP